MPFLPIAPLTCKEASGGAWLLGRHLLSGPSNSYIATLVERHTRYVMLAKVAGKDTQT